VPYERFVPFRKRGNGVAIVLTDKMEAAEEELVSVCHAADSSSEDSISIGD